MNATEREAADRILHAIGGSKEEIIRFGGAYRDFMEGVRLRAELDHPSVELPPAAAGVEKEIADREKSLREVAKNAAIDKSAGEQLMLEYALLAVLTPAQERAVYRCAEENADRLFPNWHLFPGRVYSKKCGA